MLDQCCCDVSICDYEGNNVLHDACRYNHLDIVRFLLQQKKSNPNQKNYAHKSPLQLTQMPAIISELLKHGASPAELYDTVFGKESHEPPETYVKVFIVGDQGVGKSTLTEALQTESSGFVSSLTGRFRNVSNVDQNTAGVVPHDFESNQYGRTTLYDFAGHREFYASHSAVLQTAIVSMPPLFVLVIDLRNGQESIKKSLLYWLSFLRSHCKSATQPHLLVVGSYGDVTNSKAKCDAIYSLFSSPDIHSPFHFVGVVAMDCRKPESAGITQVRRIMKMSCAALREQETLDFACHCLLVYIVDFFPDSIAVSLKQLQQNQQKYSNRRINHLKKIVPESTTELYQMCEQLNNRGHVLLLPDAENAENSWIILRKEALLSTVTGTVFAPAGMKQHCELASSTGVVAFRKFKEHIPSLDPEMVVSFLAHLEFCHLIFDEEILKLISEEQQSLKTTSNEASTPGLFFFDPTSDEASPLERFFLFPSLVSVKAPSGAWETDSRFGYHSGWLMQCQPDCIFTPRFLQLLLLRLAFSFALAPDPTDIRNDIPALQRRCQIWKNGIYWANRQGVEALVEVNRQNTEVIVMMRCLEAAEMECVHLRSNIIRKVLKVQKDSCPAVSTNELILCPSAVLNYPPESIDSPLNVTIGEVAKATAESVPCVLDRSGKAWKLEKELLHFEPYAGLGQDILHELFDEQNPSYTEEVSDDFLFGIANRAEHKLDLFKKMLNLPPGSVQFLVSQAPPGSAHALHHLLLCWRERSEGSRQCLREKLDEFSIFAGRSPLAPTPLNL